MRSAVPTLEDLSLFCILENLSLFVQSDLLGHLPEDSLLKLWSAVIRAGALTPESLNAFTRAATTSDDLHSAIDSLSLRDPPPLPAATQREWLGQHKLH